MTATKTVTKKKAGGSLELFDFKAHQVYTIKGEFGIRVMSSKDKTRQLVVFEGANTSLIAGGKGLNGKNVWIGKCPTKVSDNASDDMVDFFRAYAHMLKGEYKVYRIWGNDKSRWYLRFDNIHNDEDRWRFGFYGDDGQTPLMNRVTDGGTSSNATLTEAIES